MKYYVKQLIKNESLKLMKELRLQTTTRTQSLTLGLNIFRGLRSGEHSQKEALSLASADRSLLQAVHVETNLKRPKAFSARTTAKKYLELILSQILDKPENIISFTRQKILCLRKRSNLCICWSSPSRWYIALVCLWFYLTRSPGSIASCVGSSKRPLLMRACVRLGQGLHRPTKASSVVHHGVC